MKELILIRHAKSSWEVPMQDFDRGLTCQGIKDAHLIALHAKDFLPKSYTIWCSAAKRTINTALIFAQNIGFPLESIIYKHDLYTFELKQLEKVVRSCPNTIDNLIIFGHNNALTDFVNKFGSVPVANVSTAGFVSIQFDSEDWNLNKKGKTKKVLFPKDIK